MRAALALAALVGCAGSGNNDGPCIPPVAVPGSVEVTEGQQMAFAISLSPAASCTVSLRPDVLDTDPAPGEEVLVAPESVYLTQSAPDATITVTALHDTDTLNESYELELYIPGTIANESPSLFVNVTDSGP